jgi:sigma-E factor negative regulatory protein RseB
MNIRTGKRRSVIAAGALGVVVLAAGVGANAQTSDDGDEWNTVVDEARENVTAHDFEGDVVVEWHDDDGPHKEEIAVRQRDGLVEVDADRTLVANDSARLLVDGQHWTTLATDDAGPPELAPGKYTIASGRGPRIAGHQTMRYEASRDDRVVERMYVSDETGLVLRRERLAPNGTVARAVTFTDVRTFAPRNQSPPTTEAAANGPELVDDLDRPYRDPESVGDGFQLLGRWQHEDEVAQLYYSDGVLSISVFEQPGDLEWDELPPGGIDAEVADKRAVRYAMPGGEAWVFERAGVVYTVVGAAPASEFEAVAAAVSAPDESRIERMARMVVEPFRW